MFQVYPKIIRKKSFFVNKLILFNLYVKNSRRWKQNKIIFVTIKLTLS